MVSPIILIVLATALFVFQLVAGQYAPYAVSDKVMGVNFINVCLLGLMGIGLYFYRPQTYLLIPFVVLFMVIALIMGVTYGGTIEMAINFVVAFLALTISLSLYSRHHSKVMLDPSVRWWQVARRFKKRYPIQVTTDGMSFAAHTFDVSKSGLFIQGEQQEELLHLQVGKLIEIIINDGGEHIHLYGEIARITPGKGQYPKGIGVMVENKNGQYQGWIDQK